MKSKSWVEANSTTSMKLSKKTRDRIAKFGVAGESLETALIRILEIAEEYQRNESEKEKQKQDPLMALSDATFAIPVLA